MSLRKWLLGKVAALGAALLSGCVSSPVDPTLDPREHVPALPPNLRAHAPESPYHQLPDPGNLPPEAIRRPERHEEPPPLKVEAAPTPPAPPSQPPTDSDTTQSARVVPASQRQEIIKPAPPPDEPLLVAMRDYLQKPPRPDHALDALSHYEKPNQEMLLVVLPFAARLTGENVGAMRPDEAAILADKLQDIEDRLRQRAALHIEKMLFARKIDDFGVYVAREPVNGIHTFEGGFGDQVGEEVLVYLELRNVSSRQRGDLYETRLVGTVELIDWDNQSAYKRDFTPPPHLGRSARRDFFVKCSFSVPRKVPPGRYTMRVEIRDVTGLPPDAATVRPPMHRVASQKLDLQVTTPRPEHVATGR
jgi:hypothetical protein